jgi:hypothetical protein
MHPYGVEKRDAHLAADAFAQLAATAPGRRAIAAAHGGIKSIRTALDATCFIPFKDCTMETDLLYQDLSQCLLYLAQDADSREALQAAGVGAPYTSSS